MYTVILHTYSYLDSKYTATQWFIHIVLSVKAFCVLHNIIMLRLTLGEIDFHRIVNLIPAHHYVTYFTNVSLGHTYKSMYRS